MSIFAISDLHLSFETDKSMEIFPGWQNYTRRIKENFNKIVAEEDTVVIAGDISWATKLEEAKADLSFINSLPGKKVFIKGNHDFWWTTAKKINDFFEKNKFDTIKIVYNNFFAVEKYAVCGTRGWFYDKSGPEDEKVLLRECGRLETSLFQAENSGFEPIVFLHYPPVYGNFKNEMILKILKSHKIDTVYYGHIHGSGIKSTVSEYDGIKMKLLSADCNGFSPILVKKLKI